MSWLFGSLIVGSAIAVALFVWRKLITPWQQIEELVAQIERGERPGTFLIANDERAQRIGFRLENISNNLEQLKKQIAKRESGMQTIFAAMEDALLLVDSNRHVILTNPTFRKVFGVAEIPQSVSLREIVRSPALEDVLNDAFSGHGAIRCELGVDDSEMELHALATRNEAGEITGALVLFHDITERKKMDQVRRDFVANVSHELRTPLSILRGYIETLLDSPDTSQVELSRILGVMERHSERLDLLVEDLLTLAQLESGKSNLQLSDVDVSNFLRDIIRDWEGKLATKQLNVIVEVPPEVSPIRADRTRLQEAFYNMLDNAVKYSREQSHIRVSARNRNGAIELSVTDQGIGIAKEDLPRIFERFYRADEARSADKIRGTGLGLAIVKHIAQLHGGRVEAESELHKGTTIRLVLPSATSRSS